MKLTFRQQEAALVALLARIEELRVLVAYYWRNADSLGGRCWAMAGYWHHELCESCESYHILRDAGAEATHQQTIPVVGENSGSACAPVGRAGVAALSGGKLQPLSGTAVGQPELEPPDAEAGVEAHAALFPAPAEAAPASSLLSVEEHNRFPRGRW
jgi:hypothetical protein